MKRGNQPVLESDSRRPRLAARMSTDRLAIPIGSRWAHHSLPGVYVVENVLPSGRVALRRRGRRFEVWPSYLLANFKRLAGR